jgi:hypothetical protein
MSDQRGRVANKINPLQTFCEIYRMKIVSTDKAKS